MFLQCYICHIDTCRRVPGVYGNQTNTLFDKVFVWLPSTPIRYLFGYHLRQELSDKFQAPQHAPTQHSQIESNRNVVFKMEELQGVLPNQPPGSCTFAPEI